MKFQVPCLHCPVQHGVPGEISGEDPMDEAGAVLAAAVLLIDVYGNVVPGGSYVLQNL